MMAQFRVEATDGTDFYRQIAVVAYGSYQEHGFGRVNTRLNRWKRLPLSGFRR